MLFEYKFKYATLHSNKELDKDYVNKVSEGQLNIARKSLPFFNEERGKDYYYLQGLGPLQPSKWRLFMPLVADCKQSVTEWCVVNNCPRSIQRVLKQDKSFNDYIESRHYKHYLGTLITNGSNYGKIINKKDSTITRKISTEGRTKQLNKSLGRIRKLCKKYNVTFDESMYCGCHFSEGSIPLYQVRCNVCGTVYETYFHTSTLRVCPNCRDQKFASVREGRVAEYLRNKGIVVYKNVKGLLKFNHEIDVYLPDLKIGFEFNGYYWHSLKEPTYHLNKTEEALTNNIELYHIWEDYPDSKLFALIDSIISDKHLKTRKQVVKVSRDLCPTDKVFLRQNPIYQLSKVYEPEYVLYSAKATSEHKSNSLCKDTSKFTRLEKEGFVRVYNTGAYEFVSTKVSKGFSKE